jgi:hypothetical protein
MILDGHSESRVLVFRTMRQRVPLLFILATTVVGCLPDGQAYQDLAESRLFADEPETATTKGKPLVVGPIAIDPLKKGWSTAGDFLAAKQAIRFCLVRAKDAYSSAKTNSDVDVVLLWSSGIVAGVGLTTSAVSTAMDDGGKKKDVGQVGVGAIAATAGLLGLRAALGYSDVARAKRETAARDVDAALKILELYITTPDPKDIPSNVFDACRDGDVAIAQAFPPLASGDAIQKRIDDAKKSESDAADEKKKAGGQAKNSAASVVSGEKKIQDLTALSETTTGHATPAEKKVAEANGLDGASHSLPKDAEVALEAAKADLVKAKADDVKSRLDAAKAEMDYQRASFEARAAELLAATARLRRAVFMSTQVDVRLAADDVSNRSEDCVSARAGLKVAEDAYRGLVAAANK